MILQMTLPINGFTWPIWLIAFTCVLVIAHILDSSMRRK